MLTYNYSRLSPQLEYTTNRFLSVQTPLSSEENTYWTLRTNLDISKTFLNFFWNSFHHSYEEPLIFANFFFVLEPLAAVIEVTLVLYSGITPEELRGQIISHLKNKTLPTHCTIDSAPWPSLPSPCLIQCQAFFSHLLSISLCRFSIFPWNTVVFLAKLNGLNNC